MTTLMDQGVQLVDHWLKEVTEKNATTPELVALMLIQAETMENKLAVMTIVAATAIQRLAVGTLTDQQLENISNLLEGNPTVLRPLPTHCLDGNRPNGCRGMCTINSLTGRIEDPDCFRS